MITSFRGKYRFLSNFSEAKVTLDDGYGDFVYPTSEHAYQAAKTIDIKAREEIVYCLTPGEAKRLGGLIGTFGNPPLREGWKESNLSLSYMFAVNMQKYSLYGELKEKLLATGIEILIEGNSWGDFFWGCVWNEEKQEWEGNNYLGKILMSIRMILL